jgi:hypothetical protein
VSGIRPIIENAVATVIAEHPKYFTDRGLEKAGNAIVRKVMAALVPRSAGDEQAEPAPPAEPVEPKPLPVDPKTREGRAYTNFRAFAGAAAAFRMGDGKISLPVAAQNERVYAFADLPPEPEWRFITERPQIAAWLEFFGEVLTASARRPIQITRGDQVGILMPWPWPPSKDGKVYTSGDGTE